MNREASYPKKGYAFRSKANPNDCPFVVYLAEGLKIEDCYTEIAEEEYNAIQEEYNTAPDGLDGV